MDPITRLATAWGLILNSQSIRVETKLVAQYAERLNERLPNKFIVEVYSGATSGETEQLQRSESAESADVAAKFLLLDLKTRLCTDALKRILCNS